MKTKVCIALLLVSAIPAFAGFGEKYPIRWGKVSQAEFDMTAPKSDPSAPAVVLCDFGNIEITNRTMYERHTRIKILNDNGLQYATVKIPYQNKDRHDVFTELRAMTLIRENGKTVTYKVGQGQIEDKALGDGWSQKIITFPHVQPGAILELQYEVASLDFENLNTWYFQREIPTLWSEIRFQVPMPFVYLVTFENNRPLSPEEQVEYGKKLQWLYNEPARARRIALARNKDLLYATPENRYKVWAMNDMKKKIVMRDLPGLSKTQDNDAVTDVYPRLRFNLFESAGLFPDMFRPLIMTTRDDFDSRSERELLHDPVAAPGYVSFKMKTWDQYNNDLLNNDLLGRYLTINRGGKRLVDSINLGSRDNEARLKAVFGFVRRNFRWNGVYARQATQKPESFLKTRTGSSAEINLLLVNLLQRSGIKAYPLLLRTNDMGKPEKMYPVRNQFNHLIVLAEVDGKQVLLDATSGSSDINKLNRKDIGTEGWVVRQNSPGWIEIYAPGGKSVEEEPAFRM